MTHLIAGLVFLVLGAWGMIAWWEDFGEVLRGLIPILLVVVGLAAIGAGFQRTKDEAKFEDEEFEDGDSEQPDPDTLVHPE